MTRSKRFSLLHLISSHFPWTTIAWKRFNIQPFGMFILIFLSTVSASSFQPNTAPAFYRRNHNDSAVADTLGITPEPAASTNSSITIHRKGKKKYKLIQVQIIHRHGDRTPITPLKDEQYWTQALAPNPILESIALGTTVLRDPSSFKAHAAKGRGPFGQMTHLGILQMVALGSRLRDELLFDSSSSDKEGEDKANCHPLEKDGNIYANNGSLFSTPSSSFTTNAPILHPLNVRITSTDFPRTIQSVQALLVGLFSSSIRDIEIDVRNWNILIPDPQPRLTIEQVELEQQLASRPHVLQREEEMKHLAVKATHALRDLLAEDAYQIKFGVGEQQRTDTLTWIQLAELTTCLSIRNLLPSPLSPSDQEAIADHVAWTWFENLRNERLAQLAMSPFLLELLRNMHRSTLHNKKDERYLHIYSGHDSTLIGIMCALKLEQPPKWPAYASCLKIELFEAESIHYGCEDPTTNNDKRDGTNEEIEEKTFSVRCSLNGRVLRSSWGAGDEGYEEAADMIPWHVLANAVSREYNFSNEFGKANT